jgi:ribulose kinase
MSDHLIEEPKLDVGVLRQAVQEEYAEGPAFGAALLAGVAAGAYGSVEEATSVVELREEVTEPDPERSKAYEETLRYVPLPIPRNEEDHEPPDGSRHEELASAQLIERHQHDRT